MKYTRIYKSTITTPSRKSAEVIIIIKTYNGYKYTGMIEYKPLKLSEFRYECAKILEAIKNIST